MSGERRQVDLRAQVGPLTWPTPVGLASGTCGYGEELEGLIDWSAVGAIFTKGVSLAPRAGHPPPRIWETPCGVLNAIGLENVGLEKFVQEKMPFLRRWREQHGGKVLVNLYGTSPDEYAELAARLDGVDGVDGVEVNLSCPNVKSGGIEFGRSATGCAAVTSAVRRATRKFMIVKLSPASPVSEVARASADAGADALSTGNTMPAMAIDVQRRIPRLAGTTGGLSGPALRPINVRLTYEAARAVKLPIIGVGGIGRGEDAIEYFLAGAAAIQIGTMTFREPNAAGRVRDEILGYLQEQGESSLRSIVGALRSVDDPRRMPG